MIPNNIRRHFILRAIKKIAKNGIPPRRDSTKFDLRYGRKTFPPKYVISIAHTFVDGKQWDAGNFGGGSESNNFLVARGFLIADKKGRPIVLQSVTENESESFWEGRTLYAMHRRLERDSRLTRLVKQRRLLQKGDLVCDACGFSFQKKYGARGAGYIEAHHIKPVSELRSRARVSVADIALVCSNCHRILHRTRPWLSIQALRKEISRKSH